MQDSKIEWTDHTANLWWGCEEVHSGCDNCYARVFAKSKGKGGRMIGCSPHLLDDRLTQRP
jgi:protein gp37